MTVKTDLYYHELVGREKVIGYFNRPQDWMDVPSVVSGEQKITGLYGVYEDNTKNHTALTLTLSPASATFYVDWGDGTVDTGLQSGIQVNHSYTYSLSSGPWTSRGYRQSQVIIGVEASGGVFTIIDISSRNPSNTGDGTLSYNNWMEMYIGCGTITRLKCGNGLTTPAVLQPILEHIKWADTSCVMGSTLEDMLYGCYNFLQFSPNDFEPFDSSNTTDMTRMFMNCQNMSSVPIFKTDNVTKAYQMFQGCSRIQAAPDFNYSKLASTVGGAYSNLSCAQMYYGCSSLKYIPKPSAGRDFTSTNRTFYKMFYDCASLLTTPEFNFEYGDRMDECFRGCSKLTYTSPMNLNLATSITGFFQDCVNLTNINSLSGGQNASSYGSVFRSTSITAIPPTFYCSKATTMNYCFYALKNFLEIPETFVPVVYDYTSVSGCSSTSGSDYITTSTSFSLVAKSSTVKGIGVQPRTFVIATSGTSGISLSKPLTADMTDVVLSFDRSYCTSYDTFCGGTTSSYAPNIIKFPDSWDFCIPSGSTYSMFMYNTSISAAPKFDTRFVTSCSQMFYYARSLKYLPGGEGVGLEGIMMPEEPYDFSSVTSTITSFMSACYELEVLPDFNFSKTTSLQSCFTSCVKLATIPSVIRTGTPLNSVTSIFSGCTVLDTFPVFAAGRSGINGGVICSSMFVNCSKLGESLSPSGDFSSIVFSLEPNTTQSMFQSCTKMVHAPQITMQYCTNTVSMFTSVSELLTIPEYNVPLCTNFSNMFSGCNKLTDGKMIATSRSITYPPSPNLTDVKLNAIFDGLENLYLTTPPLTGNGITITFTGAAGENTCDKTIATNKGWITVPA